MMRRQITTLALIATLSATALLSGGCSNHDENEWQRLVCEVSAVNEGAPLVSAYLSAGADRKLGTSDDYLPIDTVPVTFHARPYSDAVSLTEDSPFSYFHITKYDLIWHPTPGVAGGDSLTLFNMFDIPTDVLVPVNGEATINILIADRYMKEFAFFRDLLPPLSEMPVGSPYWGTGKWPFNASCELRFHGHETGSSQEVEVPAAFMVSFIGVLIN